MADKETNNSRIQKKHRDAAKEVLKIIDGFTPAELEIVYWLVKWQVDHTAQFHLTDTVKW